MAPLFFEDLFDQWNSWNDVWNRFFLKYGENYKIVCEDLEDKSRKLRSVWRLSSSGAKLKGDVEEKFFARRISLIFSQGNAPVETGFSVNKNMLQDNMHERSIVSRRFFKNIFFLFGYRYFLVH